MVKMLVRRGTSMMRLDCSEAWPKKAARPANSTPAPGPRNGKPSANGSVGCMTHRIAPVSPLRSAVPPRHSRSVIGTHRLDDSSFHQRRRLLPLHPPRPKLVAGLNLESFLRPGRGPRPRTRGDGWTRGYSGTKCGGGQVQRVVEFRFNLWPSHRRPPVKFPTHCLPLASPRCAPGGFPHLGPGERTCLRTPRPRGTLCHDKPPLSLGALAGHLAGRSGRSQTRREQDLREAGRRRARSASGGNGRVPAAFEGDAPALPQLVSH